MCPSVVFIFFFFSSIRENSSPAYWFLVFDIFMAIELGVFFLRFMCRSFAEPQYVCLGRLRNHQHWAVFCGSFWCIVIRGNFLVFFSLRHTVDLTGCWRCFETVYAFLHHSHLMYCSIIGFTVPMLPNYWCCVFFCYFITLVCAP